MLAGYFLRLIDRKDTPSIIALQRTAPGERPSFWAATRADTFALANWRSFFMSPADHSRMCRAPFFLAAIPDSSRFGWKSEGRSLTTIAGVEVNRRRTPTTLHRLSISHELDSLRIEVASRELERKLLEFVHQHL